MTVFDWRIKPIHGEAQIWKAEIVADVDVISEIENLMEKIDEQES